ncbi:hypothetical protein SLA2020_522660 [Shorea laevis]
MEHGREKIRVNDTAGLLTLELAFILVMPKRTTLVVGGIDRNRTSPNPTETIDRNGSKGPLLTLTGPVAIPCWTTWTVLKLLCLAGGWLIFNFCSLVVGA